MKQPDYEALSKGISRDMSPEAIAARLRIVSELYDLAQSLSTAKCVGNVEPQVSRPDGDDSRVSST
jgi:hypothetical protein